MISRTWLGLFSLVVLAAIALLAITHPELSRQFAGHLSTLSFAPLAAALVLVLAQVSAQAMRFWAIIPRDTETGPLRAAYIFTVGDWTNIFLPARGGDALKVLLLTRSGPGWRAPVAKATGALLADKVVDVSTLIILCVLAGLTHLLAVRTRAALPAPRVMLGVGIVVLLAAVWAWRTPSSWIAAGKAGLRDVLRGQAALRHPVWLPASMSFSGAARGLEIAAMGVLCSAVGFRLSAPELLLALLAVNLSTVVPVSFGSVGIYEAGLAYGLTQSGVSLPAAITVATAHHALELLGITLSAAGYTFASKMRPNRATPPLEHYRLPAPGEIRTRDIATDEGEPS